MGLLKSILGQNPAKCEKKGDKFFGGSDWGRAKLEYEKALSQMDRRSPGYLRDEPRLQKKLTQAKESLAREHRQTCEELREAGHYEEALTAAKINFKVRPNIQWSHVAIWSYINLVREEDAREAAKKLLKLDPKFSSQKWANQVKNQKHKMQLIDALRKAGLPE